MQWKLKQLALPLQPRVTEAQNVLSTILPFYGGSLYATRTRGGAENAPYKPVNRSVSQSVSHAQNEARINSTVVAVVKLSDSQTTGSGAYLFIAAWKKKTRCFPQAHNTNRSKSKEQ